MFLNILLNLFFNIIQYIFILFPFMTMIPTLVFLLHHNLCFCVGTIFPIGIFLFGIILANCANLIFWSHVLLLRTLPMFPSLLFNSQWNPCMCYIIWTVEFPSFQSYNPHFGRIIFHRLTISKTSCCSHALYFPHYTTTESIGLAKNILWILLCLTEQYGHHIRIMLIHSPLCIWTKLLCMFVSMWTYVQDWK